MIYGLFKPKSKKEWLKSLHSRPCEIIQTTEDRYIIRIRNSGWGIRSGVVISCPIHDVQMVGAID